MSGSLRILNFAAFAQIEPPVQDQAECIENSEAIHRVFGCTRFNLVTNHDPSELLGGQIFKVGYNMLSFKLANLAGYGDQVFVELFTNVTSYGYGLYPQGAPEALSFYGFVVPDGEYFLGFTMNRTDFGSNFESTPVDQLFGATDFQLGKTNGVCNTRGCASGAVPEPTTWAMLILGFGLTGALVRRRRPVLGMA